MSKPLNILALDLATTTGWSLLESGKVESGVQVFDVKRGESPGMRFVRMRRWLNDVGARLSPGDLLVYEQAHHRGGPATACGVGLVTIALEWAADHKVEHQGVHTSTLKKHATGHGHAEKAQMIQAAESIFKKKVIDDNEADALLLLNYAMKEIVGQETKPEEKRLL